MPQLLTGQTVLSLSPKTTETLPFGRTGNRPFPHRKGCPGCAKFHFPHSFFSPAFSRSVSPAVYQASTRGGHNVEGMQILSKGFGASCRRSTDSAPDTARLCLCPRAHRHLRPSDGRELRGRPGAHHTGRAGEAASNTQ